MNSNKGNRRNSLKLSAGKTSCSMQSNESLVTIIVTIVPIKVLKLELKPQRMLNGKGHESSLWGMDFRNFKPRFQRFHEIPNYPSWMFWFLPQITSITWVRFLNNQKTLEREVSNRHHSPTSFSIRSRWENVTFFARKCLVQLYNWYSGTLIRSYNWSIRNGQWDQGCMLDMRWMVVIEVKLLKVPSPLLWMEMI